MGMTIFWKLNLRNSDQIKVYCYFHSLHSLRKIIYYREQK